MATPPKKYLNSNIKVKQIVLRLNVKFKVWINFNSLFKNEVDFTIRDCTLPIILP